MWQPLIDEWSDYMRAADLSPQTIRVRRAQLARASRHLPPHPADVTPAQLVAYMATPHWQPETRRSIRATLRGFYAYLAAFHGWTDPTPTLPRVRVPRAIPRPAPDPVVDAALDRASHRDRLLVLLAAHAGARRSEICKVAWTDITRGEPPMITLHGKGDKVRNVPLSAQLLGELDAERRRRAAGSFGSGWRYSLDPTSSWVFPGLQPGTHLGAERTGAILGQLLGDSWTGHTLRHRFATRGYAGTHDLRAVQEALGHTSLSTTQRYLAVSPQQVVDVVRAAAA